MTLPLILRDFLPRSIRSKIKFRTKQKQIHRHTRHNEEFRDRGSIDTMHCLMVELFTVNLSGRQATIRDFSATLFWNIDRKWTIEMVSRIFDRTQRCFNS